MEDTQTSSAVAETPAPSAPSAPSGDTSAATSTAPPAADSRPTSMADAFERVAAKRKADDGAAATTVPPATPGSTPDGKPATAKGPIPFDVHETALKNARTKEREAALNEWRQQHGWAEQVDRNLVAEAARIGNLLQTDRAAFVRELMGDNPDQALISEFARALSARRGQGAAVDLDPDVQITDANGTVTGATYSAQKVQAIVEKAVADALNKEVAPIKDWQQAQIAQIQQAEAQHDRQQFSTSITAELRELPHFKEHEAAIKQAFGSMTLRNPDDKNEVALALHKAYTKVLAGTVLPNLSRTEQAEAVASLKQKAVAQVQSPTGAAVAPGARPKTPQQLAKFMAERSASRSRAR